MNSPGKKSILKKAIYKLGKTRTEEVNSRIKSINRRLANRDLTKARFTLVEPYHPQSLGHLKRNGLLFNPNKGGNCSGYATRIATAVFGKQYTRGAAWELAALNEVSYRKPKNAIEISKQRLLRLIRKNVIRPGTIIGIYYPNSPQNIKGRENTHVMTYAGEGQFWHNYGGPRAISIDSIYSKTNKEGERVFFPVIVINPKRTK
ncbi:MAG: hypothetical protein WCW44_05185 [archaeon]|jgi:hypothetical protein